MNTNNVYGVVARLLCWAETRLKNPGEIISHSDTLANNEGEKVCFRKILKSISHSMAHLRVKRIGKLVYAALRPEPHPLPATWMETSSMDEWLICCLIQATPGSAALVRVSTRNPIKISTTLPRIGWVFKNSSDTRKKVGFKVVQHRVWNFMPNKLLHFVTTLWNLKKK